MWTVCSGLRACEVELARRLGDLLEHELGVEEDLLALDLLARRAEVLDRLGEHELDAQLGDDPPPAAVEDVHRLLAEDLVAGHLVDVHAAPVLDDARFHPNISSVEQEFQPTPGTQSIDRGAQLLALVLESEAPRALGELAADAGLPKSTASRLLGALERNGLVEQEGMRGAFRAGPVMARYAGRGISARRLVELAERPMAALAEATGETINVAVAGPGGRRAPRADRQPPLPRHEPLGRPPRALPLHRERQGAARVQRRRRATRASSRRARRARSSSRRSSPPSWRTCAARASPPPSTSSSWGSAPSPRPVLDDSGRAVAALSVSGPTLRLSPRRVAELRPIVIKQARALGEQLGHRTEGVHAA